MAFCRDSFLSPFAPESIWNTPLGSGAQFVHAHLWSTEGTAATVPLLLPPSNASCANETAHPLTRHTCAGAFGGITKAECGALGCCFSNHPCPGGKSCPWCFTQQHIVGPHDFHTDHETILHAHASDPYVAWFDQGWWGPAAKAPTRNNSNCNASAPSSNLQCHCDVAPNAPQIGVVQLPRNWTSSKTGNNGMAVLKSDNLTVFQTQPAYRCVENGALLSKREGCPQDYPANVSIRAGGIATAYGAHGGSGLSVLGGTVRLHEIAPDTPVTSIAHVIKLELWGHAYYYRGPKLGGAALQNATIANGGRTQYVWPATGSDSCSLHYSDTKNVYNGTSPHLAPGALLAIPSATPPLALATMLGRKIERALRDFGGYLVDDTAHDSGAICFEDGAEVAVARMYNFTLDTEGGEWYDDQLKIFKALHAVVNNAPDAVGGGGERRRPPLAPLC